MNLFSDIVENDYKTGPYFIPNHIGLSEEDQKRLSELREKYIRRVQENNNTQSK